MVDTVSFVSTAADVATVDAATRDLGTTVVVALEWPAVRELRQAGRPFVFADDVLTPDQEYDLMRAARDLSVGWWQLGAVAPLVRCGDVSLGQAAEYECFYLFLWTVRAVELALSACERFGATRVAWVAKPVPSASGLIYGARDYPLETVLDRLEPTLDCDIVRLGSIDGERDRSAHWPDVGGEPTGVARRAAHAGLRAAFGTWQVMERLRAHAGRERRRIAFLTVDMRIDSLYRPVLDRLRSDPRFAVTVLAQRHRPTREAFACGVRYVAVTDVVPAVAGSYWNALAEQVEQLDSLADFLTYRKVPLWLAVRERFRFLLRDRFPVLARTAEAVATLAGRGDLDVVVSRNELRDDMRAAILAAHARGVPTLILQHGVPNVNEPEGYMGTLGPHLSTALATSGRGWIPALSRGIVPPEKFAVTGRPQLDALARRAALVPAALAQRRKLWGVSPGSTDRLLLFVGDTAPKGKPAFEMHYTLKEREALYRGLFAQLGRLPGTRLLVKIHPSDEHADLIADLMALYGQDRCRAITHADMTELVTASDAVLISHSTVGLDAVVLDKPLVTLNFTRRPDRVPYALEGVAESVHAPDELPAAVARALARGRVADPAVRTTFLDTYAHGLDGQATARVVEVVRSLAEHGHR